MKTWSQLLAAIVMGMASHCATAALDIGETAPKFTAQAAVAGQVINYSLAEQLGSGPVVVYFFPAAFSEGCSLEAHEFAEAMEGFKAAGATVIGVSRDDIETQKKFSSSVCQGKFPVAADADQSIMKSYDAVLASRPDYANRVSYVVTPDGKILYQYTSLNPAKHVANTLNAIQTWRKSAALAAGNDHATAAK
jgi:peroxiredoxin